MDSLLLLLALPQFGLGALFVVAFLSATLLPLGSEPALVGVVHLNPGFFWSALAVATVGNTLGGVVDWYIGHGARAVADRYAASHVHVRALDLLRRLGPKACLLAWLPIVGDPLCAVAGLAADAAGPLRRLHGGGQVPALSLHHRGTALDVPALNGIVVRIGRGRGRGEARGSHHREQHRVQAGFVAAQHGAPQAQEEAIEIGHGALQGGTPAGSGVAIVRAGAPTFSELCTRPARRQRLKASGVAARSRA